MLLLGARGENDFKLVQMNLEKNSRKEIKKNGKGGRRCRANPAPLSAQRAARPASLSPSLPRAAPALSQPASPRGGRTPARSAPRPATYTPPGRDAGSGSQAIPSILSPAPLSLLPPLAQRGRTNSTAAPSPEQLRCSPLATPVPQPRRRNHQSARRSRGKLMRTLYRGESPSSTVNRSLELPRARRSAPPRRILPFPTSFRWFLVALGR